MQSGSPLNTLCKSAGGSNFTNFGLARSSFNVTCAVGTSTGEANTEADLQLRGGGTGNGGGRGFRLGSNIGGGADLFEIYSSTTNGDDDWKSLYSGQPALAIQGANNRRLLS